jgi:hypothetical protein
MNRGGFDALADCLHDYNVAICITTLEILSVTVAHRNDMRVTLETSGILKYIIKLIAQFGHDDDISERIVKVAAEVLSLALTDCPANQNYFVEHEGLLQSYPPFTYSATSLIVIVNFKINFETKEDSILHFPSARILRRLYFNW